MITEFQNLLEKLETQSEPTFNINLKKNVDIPSLIRWTLRKGIEHAGKVKNYSRNDICERMSILTGCDIKKTMIDKWTREQNPVRFPFEFGAAFCEVTGDARLACLIPGLLGLKVLESEKNLRIKLEEAEVLMITAQSRKNAIKAQLNAIKNQFKGTLDTLEVGK